MLEWVGVLVVWVVIRKGHRDILQEIWKSFVLYSIRPVQIILINWREVQDRHTHIVCNLSSSATLCLIRGLDTLKNMLFIFSDWICVREYLWNEIVEGIALGKTIFPLFFLTAKIIFTSI